MQARGLIAAALLVSCVSCGDDASNNASGETRAERKANADTLARWTREPDAVLAELHALIEARQYLKVLNALASLRRAGISDPRIDAAQRALKLSQVDAKIKIAHSASERLAAYNELAELKPGDKDVQKQIALLKGQIERAKAQAKRDEAARIAADKARRKREGVTVGMTQQDVLASSWGRPQHVNKTTYSTHTREQWVYNGEYLYFEDGILTAIQTRRYPALFACLQSVS